MFAVFLDRDGTINQDVQGYLHEPERTRLIPGAAEGIARLNRLGCLVLVVTNQSGIARGLYTEAEMHAVHARLQELLAPHGAHIDDFFFSPWHAEGTVPPWNRAHEDRKPGLGMFRQAQARYGFDAPCSWMVGDKETDIVFGRRAGLRTVLVRTGCGEHEFMARRGLWAMQPHFVAPDLTTVAGLIESAAGK